MKFSCTCYSNFECQSANVGDISVVCRYRRGYCHGHQCHSSNLCFALAVMHRAVHSRERERGTISKRELEFEPRFETCPIRAHSNSDLQLWGSNASAFTIVSPRLFS